MTRCSQLAKRDLTSANRRIAAVNALLRSFIPLLRLFACRLDILVPLLVSTRRLGAITDDYVADWEQTAQSR